MKVIILGAGRRGIRLARRLVEEKKDVVLIDEDRAAVQNALTSVDCMSMVGNGTSLEDLSDCGLSEADAFIALTGSDEENLVSCSIAASEFKVPLTIAAIRNISYTGTSGSTNSLMGITHIVNPNIEVAKRIYQDIERGIYSDMISFENSSLVLYNLYVEENSPYADHLVSEMRKELDANFIIAAMERNNNAIVPNGDSVIKVGDTLSIVARENTVGTLISSVGLKRKKPKKIAIVGASLETDYLIGKFPSEKRKNITLIDTDREICSKFADKYPEILVLNTDITHEGSFEQEGLDSNNLLLALSKHDEKNLIIASYAKSCGVRNSMALINKNPEYVRMAQNMDIDSLISAQDVTVDSLLKYLQGSNVSSLHSLFDGQIIAFEFSVQNNCPVLGKTLKDINMKGRGIIAGVSKPETGKTIIPDGSYTIQEGDTLILIMEKKAMDFIRVLLGISDESD